MNLEKMNAASNVALVSFCAKHSLKPLNHVYGVTCGFANTHKTKINVVFVPKITITALKQDFFKAFLLLIGTEP